MNNDQPDHLDPDHLDDGTLSALLDGGAGGAPAAGPEAGPPAPEVAAHLAACQRCDGRQAELSAARTALAGAVVEPLDELTRRRLVAGALQAADDNAGAAGATAGSGTGPGGSRWARRHPGLVGSAAAVVLAVLVGVPFVVGHGGSPAQNKTLSAAAPSPDAAQEAAAAFYGDLGDLTDHDRLRLRLSGNPADDTAAAPAEPGPSPAMGSPIAAPAPASAPAAGGLAGSSAARSAFPSTTFGPVSGGSGSAVKSAAPAGSTPAPESATAADSFASNDQATSRDRADADACVAALLNGPARDGRLSGSGTGTFRSRPAVVAVFQLSGGTVAFVADRAGCAVLDRFSL